MAQHYLDAGVDVVVPVDPVVSQISQIYFAQYVSGPYTAIFNAIREQGAFSSFFVCGNATHIIDLMCQTGPDSLSIDENVDLARAKEVTDRHNVVIGGNIPLTTIMLLGSQLDNIKMTIDLIDSVDGTKNLIIAPGCDMPFATPIENAIAVSHGEGRFVADDKALRKLIENGQVATQYVNAAGQPTMDIDANPNGSMEAIEGIFSPDGRVFGKMGHLERRGPFVGVNIPGNKHQPLFESGAEYFR